MDILKKFIAIGTLALASQTALASPVTVGGVTWDPDSPLDFSSTSGSFFQSLGDNGAGGLGLAGGGVVSFMNGLDNFVCATCELTYTFGGFTLNEATSSYAGGPIDTAFLDFTGGWVKFWFDNDADYSAVDGSGAGDGKLWLDLAFTNAGFLTATESLAASATAAGAGQGSGALDVVGGAAMNNFDTNTQDDGSGYMADLTFSSSITSFFGDVLPIVLPDILNGDALTPVFLHTAGTGTITLTGASIPEPTTLAVFGLGLLGLAGASRRKKA